MPGGDPTILDRLDAIPARRTDERRRWSPRLQAIEPVGPVGIGRHPLFYRDSPP